MGGGRGDVPLSAVADIKLSQGPNSISRFDRQRQATVAADLVGHAALGEAMKQIDALPVMANLAKNQPPGVKLQQSGDAENLAELGPSMASVMVIGMMMVYAVLVILFGTFLQPITILFSLPLSIGGAIAALLLTGHQLTIPVWIGVLMLMGIVTKNAIMLVEFSIESIHRGMDRDAAVVDAGQKRARPIIMTTIAMVAGMLPSALSFGAGGEIRSPMALAVIGGLIFSTDPVADLRAGDVCDDGRSLEADLAVRPAPAHLQRRGRSGPGCGSWSRRRRRSIRRSSDESGSDHGPGPCRAGGRGGAGAFDRRAGAVCRRRHRQALRERERIPVDARHADDPAAAVAEFCARQDRRSRWQRDPADGGAR